MADRDNSLGAIRERYDRANLMAIVTTSTIVFDSLRDIFYLINRVKRLEEEISELKAAQQSDRL